MRFQINCQKLAALMLASCVIPAILQATPAAALAQEPGLVEFATEPNWGGVTTASGTQLSGATASRSNPLPAVRLVSQPPAGVNQVPAPPASQGPIKLDDAAATSPALGLGDKPDPVLAGDSALTPLQNRELNIRVQVVDLSVHGLGTGKIPDAASADRVVEASYGRLASQKQVYWHPSSICHYPLRFEEAMLERHGHVRFGCLQPLASGARFFATIPMIPYLQTLQPRCEPVYALGNYRPGSCAPLLRDTIPYDSHAAVVESMALAGFFWAAPL